MCGDWIYRNYVEPILGVFLAIFFIPLFIIEYLKRR